MSFIGVGGEDWVELDLDLFERSRIDLLEAYLDDPDGHLAETLGSPFDVEVMDDGIVFIVIDGVRRYRADVDHDERLILTGILDPEGPL